MGCCTTIAQLPRISQLFGCLGLGVSVAFRIFVAQRKIRCYTLVLYLGVDSILDIPKELWGVAFAVAHIFATFAVPRMVCGK